MAHQHTYDVTMLSQRDLVLMRVENGWVIRTNEGGFAGNTTPLRVASTASGLANLVMDWATSQEEKAALPSGSTILDTGRIG